MERRGTPDESAPIKVPTFVLNPQPYILHPPGLWCTV